jgi:hypothetical protein
LGQQEANMMQLLTVTGDATKFIFVEVDRNAMRIKWMSRAMTEQEARSHLNGSQQEIEDTISWAIQHAA